MQLLITGFKRLHFVMTQIFNNKGEVPLRREEKTSLYIHLRTFGLECDTMASKNVTLSVNVELYDRYREFCKKKGLLTSRQFEIMMEKQMEEEGI